MRQFEKELAQFVPEEKTPKEDRLVMLCDGIFAIAITLLVLDIGIKSNNLTKAQLDIDLRAMIFPTISYLITFANIAMYWRSHRNLMQVVRRLDNGFISLTFLFLAFIAFFPVTSSLLGNYGNFSEVIVLYTLGLSGCGFLAFALWFYATWHHRLVDPALSQDIINMRSYHLLLNPLIFCASLLLLLLPPVREQPSYICFSWALVGFTHKFVQIVYNRWFKKPIHTLLRHEHEKQVTIPTSAGEKALELPATPPPEAQDGTEPVREEGQNAEHEAY
jgi:uncharacterized membrane protein